MRDYVFIRFINEYGQSDSCEYWLDKYQVRFSMKHGLSVLVRDSNGAIWSDSERVLYIPTDKVISVITRRI